MRLQQRRIGQDQGAIDRVFQLAHVAGPVEALQQSHGLDGATGDALAFFHVEAGDEVLD
ncbi:hypothetical protein D3C80_2036730 [compost metagenome]